MYQAIVFLPLLGAILAGLIALAGARARFPGEGPPPGAEDDAATRPRITARHPSMATRCHSRARNTRQTRTSRPPPDRARRS